MSGEKTSILILYTGGTIGMMQDPQTGSLVPFDFDNLYDHLPVLRNLDYQDAFVPNSSYISLKSMKKQAAN